MVKGLEEQIPTEEYGTVLLCDNSKACVEAVEAGKADVAAGTWAGLEYYIYETGSTLVTSLLPGQNMDADIAVSRDCDTQLLAAMNNYIYSISEDELAGYLSTGNLHPDSSSVLLFARRYPVQAMMAVTAVTALVAAIVVCLLLRASRQRAKMQAVHNRQLSQALQIARDANEAKTTFLSNMSHDIRTPMNAVLGMTQVAQKYKNDGAKLDNALANITKEGNYLLVLINSILDVNQLEHGAIELVREPFDPAACLRESVDILRPLFGKKEQHLTVQCGCKDRVVVGDANRLKQILINIISNAIKYTEAGGHIDLRLDELPENRYRFTCRDDGIGMTEEFVQHICEDYARAEDSRVSKTQGTGLGMSVVKGFTELMGGTLSIQSKLGEGSTFTVEIPFPAATEEERKTVLRPRQEREELGHEYVGRKVLLVEDNALNAEIATELLEMVGLRVEWAENGKVGIQRYEASAPDEYFAVFMDMQMPVMDGVTATRLIRQSSRPDHDIPIFAMTANTFASDRRSCREAGMTGYIPKPVSVKNIEEALTVIEK